MFNVYFAGELFDQKHITGNILLARAIEKASQQRYVCTLPQDWEGDAHSTNIAIRNKDIESVLRADCVLFNFDGPDIDSGTVVEFMVAKMVDIPVVLLRTDCRNGGYLFGDNWNLMLSSYPRSYVVTWNALVGYNNLNHDMQAMHTILATSIIEGFEKARGESPLLNTSEELLSAYKHVVNMCGGNLQKSLPVEALQNIIAAKMQKNHHEATGDNFIKNVTL